MMSTSDERTTRDSWVVVTLRFAAERPIDDGLADDWLDRISERIIERIDTTYGLDHYTGSVSIVDADTTDSDGSDDGNK